MDSKPDIVIYDRGIKFILEMMYGSPSNDLLKLMINALIVIQTRKELILTQEGLRSLRAEDTQDSVA